MNTLLLQPTDVIFFRDGRPMEGSLAGHGAAWPLPSVTDAALHAALHRSGLLEQAHTHRRGRSGGYSPDPKHRDRKLGSLLTAGPFPVRVSQVSSEGPTAKSDATPTSSRVTWYFPRPHDLQDNTVTPSLLPSMAVDWPVTSSLPKPLHYAVANTQGPAKESGARAWLALDAVQAYLNGTSRSLHQGEALNDADFFDAEHNIGIAVDPDRQSAGQGQAEGRVYSAHYLRLRDDWRLGVLSKAIDEELKTFDGDLVKALFNGDDTHEIVVGGQQRPCTATLARETGRLPLPLGRSDGFAKVSLDGRERWLVKWVLLSPAVWPEIIEGKSKRGTERRAHPGGWIPNWIDATSGKMLLRVVGQPERRRRRLLNYDGKGYRTDENAAAISADLVAALVAKPIPVTGWALPNESADNPRGGAKNTHLAVSAGAVYYFAAHSESDAHLLANTLNWHGAPNAPQFGKVIKNRRSTLFGEKGFGLGVCGTWEFYREGGVD